VRKAVAIALQRVGDRDVDALFRTIRPWVTGRPSLQRAAAAAVCGRRLLTLAAVVADPVDGKRALERWARSAGPAVQWIVRENLRRRRLTLMDPGRTARLSKP